MKKTFIFLLIMVLSILSACSAENEAKAKDEPFVDYEKVLNEAKEIKITENPLSLGKEYKISVDGQEVAKVTGKIFKDFGEEFILKDKNDNFLIKEKQIKRWGVKFERMAEFLNEEDEPQGYIGEKVVTKMFSIGYTFHFYDKNKEEIGVSDEVNFSLLKEHNFYDNDGNEEYLVQKEVNFLVDEYTLKVKENDDIPLYQAILMVCIEDAIKDAKEEKEK